MKYLKITEAAARCGISERRLQQLCKSGDITGAKKDGRSWLVPEAALTGIHAKAEKRPSLLPLPVGISGYVEAVTHYYYVDKTLLIRDFIDALP